LPKQKKDDADYRIDDKKSIIPFKPRIMIFFMMVGMEIPKKAMHNVFMAEPCHEFHEAESKDENEYMNPHN